MDIINKRGTIALMELFCLSITDIPACMIIGMMFGFQGSGIRGRNACGFFLPEPPAPRPPLK
jgi:hypothetical protein